MPPKVKTTKEDIINTAVEIVRKSGEQAINARTIATMLNCSTQPIFSNFATMDQLRYAVVDMAETLYQEYTRREIDTRKYPVYKATGMAYICFAKEEKELFKLLFMRDRSAEMITNCPKNILEIVKNSTGLEDKNAEFFHFEMWAYVHGIAAMIATNYLEFDTELASEMLSDAYYGLKQRYETKGVSGWKRSK